MIIAALADHRDAGLLTVNALLHCEALAVNLVSLLASELKFIRCSVDSFYRASVTAVCKLIILLDFSS